jgi:hypothetical protein
MSRKETEDKLLAISDKCADLALEWLNKPHDWVDLSASVNYMNIVRASAMALDAVTRSRSHCTVPDQV